jgi:hypothetical protein
MTIVSSRATALAAAALVVLAGSAAGSSAPAPSAHTPSAHAPSAPDPADFTTPVANAYFPIAPGLTVRLRGHDGAERLHERVHVTHRTRTIQGIEVRVVRDVVRRPDGSVAERTTDWYAADNDGNVWYFGERTATLDEHGQVESREGSWQAGRDGARAGIVMPADPHPAQAFRQELYRGHAEDQAWIVGREARATVQAGRFRHLVHTLEWTRLEPGVVSSKLYARGVGIIRETDLAGGHETFEVVSVTP